MKNALAFAIALFSLNLLASSVEFTGSPTVVSVSGQKVEVHPEVKTKLAGEAEVALKLSGAGIRKKTVFFVPVNVYYAASYVVDPAVFKGTSPLEGLNASPVRVLKLTMLRNLSGSEIRQSFEEALKFNNVDLNATGMANVFSQFTVDANPGDTFTIVSHPHNSMERLIVELPSKTISEEAKDLGLDFLKVWFGKPIDGGIEDLQKLLVGNQ